MIGRLLFNNELDNLDKQLCLPRAFESTGRDNQCFYALTSRDQRVQLFWTRTRPGPDSGPTGSGPDKRFVSFRDQRVQLFWTRTLVTLTFCTQTRVLVRVWTYPLVSTDEEIPTSIRRHQCQLWSQLRGILPQNGHCDARVKRKRRHGLSLEVVEKLPKCLLLCQILNWDMKCLSSIT